MALWRGTWVLCLAGTNTAPHLPHRHCPHSCPSTKHGQPCTPVLFLPFPGVVFLPAAPHHLHALKQNIFTLPSPSRYLSASQAIPSCPSLQHLLPCTCFIHLLSLSLSSCIPSSPSGLSCYTQATSHVHASLVRDRMDIGVKQHTQNDCQT